MGTFLGISGWWILSGVVCYIAGALTGKPIINWIARKVMEITK